VAKLICARVLLANEPNGPLPQGVGQKHTHTYIYIHTHTPDITPNASDDSAQLSLQREYRIVADS